MMKRSFTFAAFLVFLLVIAPARAVTINVTYSDASGEGFFDATLGAQRRSAFEAAASQWGQTLGGTVPISVSAKFEDLGGENAQGLARLGFASPIFFQGFAGAPQANTYYVGALGNQFAGSDLFPSQPDITAEFNSRVDGDVFGSTGFYYGTDLNAGNNIDFYSVVLHELGHGLGFLDAMNSEGTYFFTNPSLPSIWDRHLSNGSSAGATLFPSLTPAQRKAAMTSNLFFSGTNTRAANNNLNANIYAPNPYQDGSSTAHLDETKYSRPPDGTASNIAEELMTPISSENTHTIGPIILGIMRDLGWTLQSSTPSIGISDVTVTEGNSGTINAVLTLTLSAASTQVVSANFATASNSATSGSDFTAASGTVSFPIGQTTRTISIPIIGDTATEGDETFFVNLTTPVNATLADTQGVVLIRDDDLNATPVNGTLSPASASNAPNSARLFATTFSDANGNADFSYVMLHVNTSTSAVAALRCQLNTVNNKIYLRNDANTLWLGGFAVGSANVISNGQGSIDCAQTTIARSGNTVTVNWALKASGTWAGTTQKTYLYSQDKQAAKDGFDQKGTWTISGNVAPANVSLSPPNLLSTPNAERALTAVYSDANGSGNLSQVLLRVGPGTADGFRAQYNPLTNLLYVLNDAGTSYIGGIAPGTASSISNSRGRLNCALTTITRSTTTITVNWRVALLNSSWVGTSQSVSLFCKDRANLTDGFDNFSAWVLNAASAIQNSASPALSSAEAFAGTNAVQLTFTGALDIDSASDAGNYDVIVNGNPTPVPRADVAGSQVTLRVSSSLRAKDRVVVIWRDLPGSGTVELAAQ